MKVTGVLTPVALFALVVVVVVAACGPARRIPTPVEAPVAVEDDRYDESGTPAASGSPSSDTLADEDAAAGSPSRRIAIKVRGLDVHRAMRFAAEAVRENVLVVGGSTAPLSFDIEATQGSEAITEVARRAALDTRARDRMTLVAASTLLARLEAAGVHGDDRDVDLAFVLADAGDVVRLLSDVSRVEVTGDLDGSLSVLARGVGSAALLDALVALGGGHATLAGPVTLPQGASLPAVTGWPPSPEPEPCPEGGYRYRVAAGCVAVDALELRALALVTGREPLALVAPRAGIPGPWRGEVVRRGDFVGFPRRDPSGEEHFWRIESIDEHGLRLVLVRDPESGSLVAGAPEVTLPLASTP